MPTLAQARKRPVNLTLNEDLVAQARSLSGNLSAVVERLLADYIAYENTQAEARNKAFEQSIAVWNDFATGQGSYADDHTTL